MKVAGYEIVRKEEYKAGHYVALGLHADGRAVTWESSGDADYYWGHYFSNEKDALIDYHKRLIECIEDWT